MGRKDAVNMRRRRVISQMHTRPNPIAVMIRRVTPPRFSPDLLFLAFGVFWPTAGNAS
jgi:hypothetical protein